MGTRQFFVKCRKGEPLRSGLVLAHEANGQEHFQRITHVFERTVFVMGVSSPEQARYAKRPKPLPRGVVENQILLGTYRLGRINLPGEFVRTYAAGSKEQVEIHHKKSQLEPLLKELDSEASLHRTRFTMAVWNRSVELTVSDVSLRRLLLRYWYFGGLDQALLALRTGPKNEIESDGAVDPDQDRPEGEPSAPQRKRAGAKPRLVEAKRYPEISFIPGELDFADMVAAVERLAKKASTTWVAAHEEYLKVEFSRRHPSLAKDYADDKILCPVSLRQFTRFVKREEEISAALRANVPGLSGSRSQRALHSTGPGDVYEVDATGGQIYLTASSDPNRVLAHPTIYVLIDRWSRFVVAVYITLDPPSWRALRMLLRIAFTSRKERFKHVLNIDEERWPIGVVPAQLATDRGSEMISKQMLEAAVDGLLIEPLVLPPLTPDGKAIVERVIGTLKKKLKSAGTPGVHDKVVVGPVAAKNLKKARGAAVHTLISLYRILLDVVDDYNNRPHKSLKARAELRQAGVRPTPRAAYAWGLENLTGIQRPPLSDDDYLRLTLLRAKGNLSDRVLRCGRWRYFPDNAAAARLAKRSTSQARPHDVAFDRTLPTTVYSFGTSGEEWPRWRIEPAGQSWYERMTLEEEETLAEHHSLVHAQADHDAARERFARPSPEKPRRRGSATPTKAGTSMQEGLLKRQESASLDQALLGKTLSAQVRSSSRVSAVQKRAQELDDQEEAVLIERARSRKTGKKGDEE